MNWTSIGVAAALATLLVAVMNVWVVVRYSRKQNASGAEANRLLVTLGETMTLIERRIRELDQYTVDLLEYQEAMRLETRLGALQVVWLEADIGAEVCEGLDRAPLDYVKDQVRRLGFGQFVEHMWSTGVTPTGPMEDALRTVEVYRDRVLSLETDLSRAVTLDPLLEQLKAAFEDVQRQCATLMQAERSEAAARAASVRRLQP